MAIAASSSVLDIRNATFGLGIEMVFPNVVLALQVVSEWYVDPALRSFVSRFGGHGLVKASKAGQPVETSMNRSWQGPMSTKRASALHDGLTTRADVLKDRQCSERGSMFKTQAGTGRQAGYHKGQSCSSPSIAV